MEYKNIREDFYAEFVNASSVTYTIYDGDVAIYTGKAYCNPDTGMIRVNVAQRVRDYLKNEMPDFRDYDGVLVPHPEAVKTFFVMNEDIGVVQETYQVLLDYSEPWDGGTLIMADPINTHADPRQKLFFPLFSSGSTPVNIDDSGGSGNVSGTPGADEIWVNKEAEAPDGWFAIRYRPELDSDGFVSDIYGHYYHYGTVNYEVIETETHKIIRFPFSLFYSRNIKFKDTVRNLYWVKTGPAYVGEKNDGVGPFIAPDTSPNHLRSNDELTSITMTYTAEWKNWYAENHPSWHPSNYDGVYYDATAFQSCYALTEIVFPTEVPATIGHMAFSACHELERLDVRSNGATLTIDAFHNCSKLNYVSLPASLSIYTSGFGSLSPVFSNCPMLTEIDYRGTVSQFNSVNNKQWLAAPGVVVHCTDGDVTL